MIKLVSYSSLSVLLAALRRACVLFCIQRVSPAVGKFKDGFQVLIGWAGPPDEQQGLPSSNGLLVSAHQKAVRLCKLRKHGKKLVQARQ
jgi:hypothetical protein